MKKKVLFLHGFLGGPEDMRPLQLEGIDFESVDLRKYLNKKLNIFRDFPGPYDLALGYSFGGRVLAKLLMAHPEYVKTPVFASSRLSSWSSTDLAEREKIKNSLLKLERVYLDHYWKTLPLFGGHSMTDYRKDYGIEYKPWTNQEISHYLNYEFTYPALNLSDFYDRSLYMYGTKDTKYEKEAMKLPMTSESYEGGHRFVFEQVPEVKKRLGELVAA